MFICVCFHIDNYVQNDNSSPLIFPIIISECLYSQGWLKPSTIVKHPGSVLPSQPTNHLPQHFRIKSQDKQCPHWSLVPAFQSPPHFFSAPLWRGGDAIDPSLWIFILWCFKKQMKMARLVVHHDHHPMAAFHTIIIDPGKQTQPSTNIPWGKPPSHSQTAKSSTQFFLYTHTM